MKNRWNFSRWKNKERYVHDSLSEFLNAKEICDGVHEIDYFGNKFHFMFLDQNSENMVFVFHGAIRPNLVTTAKLPKFAGVNFSKGVDANFVLFSDPGLAMAKNPIQLAWFSGDLENNAPSIIAEISKKLIAIRRYRNVIFCGGSGGGFAALRASLNVKDSLALVWNPQTNLAKYYPRLVKEYLRSCFGVSAFDELPQSLHDERKFSLIDHIDKDRSSKIVYLQNLNDKFHVRNHSFPFRDIFSFPIAKSCGVDYLAEDVVYVSGSWGDGHVPPAPETVTCLLQELLKNNLNLSALSHFIHNNSLSFFGE